MAWHCTLDRWNQIHPSYRAKMIAHFIYRSQREAYIAEYFAPKDSKGEGNDRYQSMMKMMH